MTGLEKIINEIGEEAGISAKKKVEAARAEAESLLAEVRKESEAIMSEADEKTAELIKSYKSRAASSAEQIKKTALLSAKQKMIAEVIEKAKKMLKEESAEEYFGMLERLLKKYAHAGSGELYLSAEDLKRVPDGFEEKVNAAAAEKGGSLVLMKEPKDISDGFLLVYGGVEENCTLKALFEAKQGDLWDIVNGILFA